MMKRVAQTPAGSFWTCLRSWHDSFLATGYFSQRVGEQSFRLLIQPGLFQGRAQATLQIGIRQLRTRSEMQYIAAGSLGGGNVTTGQGPDGKPESLPLIK